MAGDSGMAGKVALLLWAQTLGLAGAQTPQLLVEPPWTPAVLWDRVTLTCQGSGTAGATTWYKDGRAWGQEGPDIFTVTRSGTYQCQRPGTGLSPPVTVSDDWLVLQVPARALLEGDTVTLRCRVWQNNPVTSVSFYRDGKELGTLQNGTELSLSPLQRNHSGHYHCRGWLGFLGRWEQSEPVAVTVQVPVANATITPGPPALQVTPLLEVTPQGTTGHLWNTVLAGVFGSLLFLVLLIVAVCCGHRMSARKLQGRAPPLEDPQATYMELRGPQGQPWEPSDIYGNLQQNLQEAPGQEGAGLDPHVVGTERAGGEHEELPGPHGRQRDRNDSYENIL
ncbi:low affinity immunoglobulin gamma Fc region receptor III-like isoform X7 [Catharus ustulatus]|uniref:low affinity immunoglobulin gamma Fc region receptor III-like isoform X7 n=1 Tax=Catharus ustulatus TaxID=91951 RepID=UPI001407EC83|nr:low affinity immunoglobulin gamma Fc region receptor III-like isoform X7 [Catharus ustulatus]